MTHFREINQNVHFGLKRLFLNLNRPKIGQTGFFWQNPKKVTSVALRSPSFVRSLRKFLRRNFDISTERTDGRTWQWNMSRLVDNGKNSQKYHFVTTSNVFFTKNWPKQPKKNFPIQKVPKMIWSNCLFVDQVIAISDVWFWTNVWKHEFWPKMLFSIIFLQKKFKTRFFPIIWLEHFQPHQNVALCKKYRNLLHGFLDMLPHTDGRTHKPESMGLRGWCQETKKQKKMNIKHKNSRKWQKIQKHYFTTTRNSFFCLQINCLCWEIWV